MILAAPRTRSSAFAVCQNGLRSSWIVSESVRSNGLIYKFFTSYNKPELTNRCMLLKVLSFPMVVDLYAKPPFFVRCASSASCGIR
jgi:hypothetical protein